MKLRTIIAPLFYGVLSIGIAVSGYLTREQWLPLVFPAKSEKPKDPHAGHSHGDQAGENHEGHDHAGHDHGATDRVKLSPQAQANLKLDVDSLEPQPYWRTIVIPGIVVERPGESDRSITAKLAGIVAEIYAKPGDSVKAGDPIFKLQLVSEFVQSTQNELAKAAQELRIATAKRDRTANLVSLGTESKTALIDDEAVVKRFSTAVQSYRRQLQVFGFVTEQIDKAERGEPVTEVIVRAPGATSQVYEVQDLKVQLGESVLAGQTLGTMANHQRLFVEGKAFKSEATALAASAQAKAQVFAEFVDEPPGTWPAQKPLLIHHLSNQVDPVTRTFAFFLALDNEARTYEQDDRTHFVWRYRPGQRVRLKVPVEKLGESVYVLPAGAVVREGAEAFVFVQNGDLFVRKPVRLLYEDRKEAVIPDDGTISPAMFIAKNQAAALNRALKAATGGGGGGHEGHDHAH